MVSVILATGTWGVETDRGLNADMSRQDDEITISVRRTPVILNAANWALTNAGDKASPSCKEVWLQSLGRDSGHLGSRVAPVGPGQRLCMFPILR